MDTAESDRQLIQAILKEYARIPYSYGDTQIQTVFDRDNDHYLLMIVGWDGIRRDHGCLVHVDIINGMFWIHAIKPSTGSHVNSSTPGYQKTALCSAFRSLEDAPDDRLRCRVKHQRLAGRTSPSKFAADRAAEFARLRRPLPKSLMRSCRTKTFAALCCLYSRSRCRTFKVGSRIGASSDSMGGACDCSLGANCSHIGIRRGMGHDRPRCAVHRLVALAVLAMGRAVLSALQTYPVQEWLLCTPDGRRTNHVRNGLLLRADLHTLFDLGLLTVNTATMTIVAASRLSGSIYAELDGRKVRPPGDLQDEPNPRFLEHHRDKFNSELNS